jgi:hypothetical protein
MDLTVSGLRYLIGKHDAQATTALGGSSPGLPHSIWKAVFLNAFCAAMLRWG